MKGGMQKLLLAALSDIVGSRVGLRMFSVVVVFCAIVVGVVVVVVVVVGVVVVGVVVGRGQSAFTRNTKL